MPVTAKRIRISSDGGTVYNTLPGNSAELRNEAGEIVDTIFGQPFSSSEAGLIGWSIATNALYKGFAGYVATIKRQGATTAMADEAMNQVAATQTYEVTDTTRQIWDTAVALSVLDNGVAVATTDIEDIDYLYGRVTFDAAYVVTGPVTVTGSFFPTIDLCGANSFTLTQTAEGIDETDMCLASSNGGYRIFDYGLRTVNMELSGFYRAIYGNLAQLQSRDVVVIELNPDGGGNTVARGFFRLTQQSQSGDVGALEEESLTYQLNVPDVNLLSTPFRWNHSAGTNLNQAVRDSMDAWEQGNELNVQYLHDGSNGQEGLAIVTEMSLTGGLEVMNEFSVTLQGTGISTPVAL